MTEATIVVDYVELGDGPAVRFLVRSSSDVESLQGLFRGVMNLKHQQTLALDEGFSLQGLSDLRLTHGGHPWLRRISSSVFEWGGDGDAWESRAQLIDGLALRGEFQYLDYDEAGDAQVIVEFLGHPAKPDL